LVPFLYALNSAESYLLVGGSRARLFEHDATRAGDSSTGWRQGSGESSAGFCVAIHPEVVALDEELQPWGGGSRFLMDDGYAYGPAHVVFPAVFSFLARVREALDLESSPGKLACFSHEHDLLHCPVRQHHMVPIGQCDILIRTEVERQTMHSEVIGSAYGILVAGVPVGEPQYEYEQMRVIGDRYVSYAYTTLDQLRDEPHHMWTLIFYCLQPDLDYFLRHTPPSATTTAAECVDHAYLRCVRDLEVDPTGVFFTDPLLMRRFRLRVGSPFGAGCRSRVTITLAAFASCLAESAQQFLARVDSWRNGGVRGF